MDSRRGEAFIPRRNLLLDDVNKISLVLEISSSAAIFPSELGLESLKVASVSEVHMQLPLRLYVHHIGSGDCVLLLSCSANNGMGCTVCDCHAHRTRKGITFSQR